MQRRFWKPVLRYYFCHTKEVGRYTIVLIRAAVLLLLGLINQFNELNLSWCINRFDRRSESKVLAWATVWYHIKRLQCYTFLFENITWNKTLETIRNVRLKHHTHLFLFCVICGRAVCIPVRNTVFSVWSNWVLHFLSSISYVQSEYLKETQFYPSSI